MITLFCSFYRLYFRDYRNKAFQCFKTKYKQNEITTQSDHENLKLFEGSILMTNTEICRISRGGEQRKIKGSREAL